jgi:carbon storage regulator
MLVLSRKPLQSIMIGPDIRITVVKVERNQVRIGIEAPRDVTILRDELIETGDSRPGVGSESGAKGHVVTV